MKIRNTLKKHTTMKKLMIILTALFTMTVSANAMSYEQARQQAADLAAQAEKDGAARLLAVSAGAQEQLREAKRLADEQAQAFSAELNKTTAEQCAALEQAAKSHADAAASMIVERIWDSEWQS